MRTVMFKIKYKDVCSWGNLGNGCEVVETGCVALENSGDVLCFGKKIIFNTVYFSWVVIYRNVRTRVKNDAKRNWTPANMTFYRHFAKPKSYKVRTLLAD